MRDRFVLVLLVFFFFFSILVKADIALEMATSAFIGQLTRGDYQGAYQRFDRTMKTNMTMGGLAETWQVLMMQTGALKEQLSTKSFKHDGYIVVIVTCAFERMVLDIQVVYNKENEISGLWFNPSQAPLEIQEKEVPANIREEELTLGLENWPLSATLTQSQRNNSCPLVILVHGSGIHDRDETIGPNKPFRDLAWGLAQEGIAVLRYEKRTASYGENSFTKGANLDEEVIDDLLAILEEVKDLPLISSEEIYVLGHSLGGMLLPMIALRTDIPKGYISLAGPARPMEDLILEQTSYLLSLDNDSPIKTKEEFLRQLREQVALVKSEDLSLLTEEQDLPLGIPASYWLSLRGYEPAELAKGIAKPFLIIQGGRDYQVTAVDYNMWREALEDREDVQFKFYPNLNHIFQLGQGKPSPDEYLVPGEVDKQLIKDISLWIKSWFRN